jgi:DNA-binding NarL/FixJ family response regulator
MRPITVLVAARRRTTRRACLAALADAAGVRVVAEARSPAECLLRVRDARPHVVVLAAPLDSPRARTLLDALSAAPRLRVLVVAAGARDEIIDALAQGARGHLSPARVRAWLARAVRVVAGGDLWCSRALIATVVTRVARTQSARGIVPTDTAPWSNGRRSRRAAR